MKSGGVKLGFLLVSVLIIFSFLSSIVVAETPRVQSTNPSDGFTNVPLNVGQIGFTFNTPISTLYWIDNVGIETKKGFETNRIISFEESNGANNYVIVLDDSPLFKNTEYTISIGDFENEDGEVMEEYSFSFKTESGFKLNNYILPAGLTVLAILLVVLIVFFLKNMGHNKKVAKLISKIENAIAVEDAQKARGLYTKIEKHFNKLSKDERKAYSTRIRDIHRQISRM